MKRLIWFSKKATSRGSNSISTPHRLILASAGISAIIAGSLLAVSVNLPSSLPFVGIIAAMSFGLTGLIFTRTEETSQAKIACPSCGFGQEMGTPRCSNCGHIFAEEHALKSPISAFSLSNILAAAALVVSLILVLLVPSASQVLIWADWHSIPAASYLRAIGSILLTTFLPGYFLLSSMNHARMFRNMETLLLSYLLSLLVVPAWSVATSMVGLSLRASGVVLVAILNLGVFVVFLVSNAFAGLRGNDWLEKSMNMPRIRLSRIHIYSMISVIAGLAFTIAMSYRMFTSPPAIWETDEWANHAIARVYEKFGNMIFSTRLLPVNTQYPRWFQIYLASLFSVSGMPTANTYLLINFSNVFGLVALYLLASSFLKKYEPRIGPVAVGLASFSGLGWIYDLWLRWSNSPGNTMTRLYESSISTYDIFFANTFFGSAHPQLTTGLQVMALPALLALLWLCNRDDFRGRIQYAMIALLTSLATLAHVVEGGIFVGILVIIVVASERISWRVCLAAVLGVLTTGLVGLLMPDKYYVTLTAYYLTLAGSGLALLISFVKAKNPRLISLHLGLRSRHHLAIVTSATGLGVWLALLMLWRFSGYSTFNVWWDCPKCTITVPPYMYPNRFGALGLLAIPAIVFILLVWRKEIRGAIITLGLALIGLILGRMWMLPELYRFTGLEEFRWNKYVALALTIPVAIFLVKGLHRDRLTSRRILLGGMFLSILLFSGLTSTVLYSEFTQLAYTQSQIWRPDQQNTFEFNAILTHQFTPEEMHAIQFLVDNLRDSEAVAFVGGTYWNQGSLTFMKLAFLGGLLMNQTFSMYALYGLKSRDAMYQRLSAAKVAFIYLNLEDRGVLQQHLQVYEAVTALSVVFQNRDVTIYSFNA